MNALGHAGSLFFAAVAGVALIVVGAIDGGTGWPAIALGVALIAVVVGLIKLDPPSRRPRRDPWRPWRDVPRREG